MTAFLISLIIAFFCLIIIAVFKTSGRKIGDHVLAIAACVILLFDAILGFGIIPSVRAVETEYVELTNYGIVKSKNAVVIDLSNSSYRDDYNPLRIFNTYDMVTSFNDSTKFFMEHRKSFYGFNVYSTVTWSNPPYTNFNRK
jgi:hypothetical protein